MNKFQLISIAALVTVSTQALSEEIRSLPQFHEKTGFGSLMFNRTAQNRVQAQKTYKRYNPVDSSDLLSQQSTNCYVFNHYQPDMEGTTSFVYVRIEKYSSSKLAYNLYLDRNQGWISESKGLPLPPLSEVVTSLTANEFSLKHKYTCSTQDVAKCEGDLLSELQARKIEIHGKTSSDGYRSISYRNVYGDDDAIPQTVLVEHRFYRFTVTANLTSTDMPAFCHDNSFGKIKIKTFSPISASFAHELTISRR